MKVLRLTCVIILGGLVVAILAFYPAYHVLTASYHP
jgi:hypothetical protein